METIKTKKPLSAEVASTVLSGLYDNCPDIIAGDGECYRRYKALKDYIDGLLDVGSDMEIVDMYLVVEHVQIGEK